MNKKTSAFLCVIFLATVSLGGMAYASDEKPNFAEDRLTGNWGGARDRLFDQGYAFDFYYKADAWRNFSGGSQQGGRAGDNLDLKMMIDGKKAFHSEGTTVLLYFLNNNGGRINDIVGSNGGIDNIEVPTHAFKLYEAWVEQNWMNDRFSILLGLHDLNSEFYVTDTSGLFINPTFGIGTEMAATGDNGPSIFPATSLAARIAFKPTEASYIKAAIFDGVPGDAGNPKGTHINFDDKDGALLVAEGGLQDDAIGHFAIGAWEYTARRPDQLTPAERRHSKGVYFLADKSVYANGDKDISAFARFGFTAGDVEQFRHSWGTGFVLSGFVPDRADGQIGIGIANAANARKFKAANAPVEGNETQIELTYSDKLTPWLSIQPDLQYTVNPGTDPALDNAWTAGIRLGVDF